MDDVVVLSARTGIRVADTRFEEFFERHRDRLFRAVWLVCRNRHEAEEICQEAFLRLWERWDRVVRLEEPAGYLFRTAMNLHRNRRRKAAVAIRRLAGSSPPRDELEAVETRDAVVRALGRLTSRQRAALVLIDLLDMTSEQAARALGVRAATVRVLAARGRAALKSEIGDGDA
jgi:RNA polymerase sigma-70 factor, ECF subfamily